MTAVTRVLVVVAVVLLGTSVHARPEAGAHDLRVGFTQGGGGAELQVFWSGPGVEEQQIPATVATTSVTSLVTPDVQVAALPAVRFLNAQLLLAEWRVDEARALLEGLERLEGDDPDRLAALAEPVVTLIYQRGAFGAEDARAVAQVLQIFCWAVPGWILQTIAVRAFYARGDTWRPMLLGTPPALAALVLPLAALAAGVGITVLWRAWPPRMAAGPAAG